jgi:serine/threonine protein kinase/Flp pilus assembly protein TadD
MGIKCSKCQHENPEDTLYCGKCGAPLKPASDVAVTETIEVPKDELARGTIFANRYEIIEELGKGGMGRVYKVHDEEIAEEVALKLLKPDIASDEKTIERFRNELKIARKVSHKNVCRMYDIGREDEKYFITMEYVAGEDLKSLIRKKGGLSTKEAIGIAQQVCEGLAEAHRLGVVHRDLKPQNIMIDTEGNAKIMDFGIARSVEAPGVTATGVIVGTPDYISPEQAEGEEADHRSDIYSLGVILYEMVTGNVPFKGDTAFSVALKHKTQLPQDPRKLNPEVSDDLSRLILICMEKEKARRYQTAEVLFNDLRNIEEGFPLGTKMRPKRATFVSALIRKKLFIPVMAVALALVVVAIWRLLPQKNVISPELSGRPSVAIMYFKNSTGDKSLDHLSESIPSQLTYDLEQSKYLYVLRNDRLIQIMDKLDLQEKGDYPTDVLAKVADMAVVEYIIQGAYFKSGDDFRIFIRILKAGSWEVVGTINLPGRIDRQMAMVDELTQLVKPYFDISAQDIAADIDFDIGKVTTESPEAFTNFNQGLKYFGKADWWTAIELFKKAVAEDPEFALARGFLGWTYLKPGQSINRAQGKEHLEKALSLTGRLSERERLFVEAIHYYLLERQWGNAIESLKKILQLYPEDWLANYMLGNFYVRLEEWEKARDLFLVNKRNKVDFAENYRSLAEAYKFGGLYDEAVEVCEYALQNLSDTAFLRYELAQTYICKGQLDRALEEVNKAQLIHPFTSAYYGSLIWLKGNILMYREDWPGAEQEFRRLLEMIDPLIKIYGFEQLGCLFKTQGRMEDCIEANKKGMETAKSMTWASAEMRFKENLALAYLESGNPAEALEESERMMLFANSQPQSVSRWRLFYPPFLKGYICARAGAVEEAQNAVDEVKVNVDNWLDKKLVRYHDLLMGMIEFGKGNYKDAERYQERALSLLPFQVPYNTEFVDHAVFHNALAMTYLKLGEVDNAQEQYEKIVSLTVGRFKFGAIYAKSYYMLGKIYEQKGNTAKAKEHYEKFLTLWKDADPGLPEIEDARKRLAGLQQ